MNSPSRNFGIMGQIGKYGKDATSQFHIMWWWWLGCVDFEIFLIFNLGLIIFDGDGYSNGHRSQKNYFQIYLDPPQID